MFGVYFVATNGTFGQQSSSMQGTVGSTAHIADKQWTSPMPRIPVKVNDGRPVVRTPWKQWTPTEVRWGRAGGTGIAVFGCGCISVASYHNSGSSTL